MAADYMAATTKTLADINKDNALAYGTEDDFKESDHPRNQSGEFSSGGGSNKGGSSKVDWSILREGTAHGNKFTHNGKVIERKTAISGASHVGGAERWYVNGKQTSKKELKELLGLT